MTRKTKTKRIQQGFIDKNFISDEEYEAIRFVDNGGKPDIKKKNYKYIVKEYKRHLIILISWFIKKYKVLKLNISKKIKVKNSSDIISSKLERTGWKKLEKIYKICLEYSKQRKTRKTSK